MTPPTMAPVWFEELDFVELDAETVLVGEEARTGEKFEGDVGDAEVEGDAEDDVEAEPVDVEAELVDDADFEVLDGLTSVVTPSMTKTPFLSLQQFSASVPFPQQ